MQPRRGIVDRRGPTSRPGVVMDDAPRDIVDRIKALTAADRCDQCGAQAYVESFHQHGRLLWCMSHYRTHAAKLAEAGGRVIVHHSEYQALAH